MSAPPLRIALNGFGRIGRTILRQLMTTRPEPGIEIALINDIAARDLCAHLFAYDSVYGPFQGAVSHDADTLTVNGTRIPLAQTDDISTLDLSGIDLVLECTGKAKSADIARRACTAGARRVLISGPSGAADATLVLGFNEQSFNDQTILSNASCTTNAIVPLLHALDTEFGLHQAHMTTVHCYTSSQPMIDAPRGDLARSRAGALSMVPTTTSATGLITELMPHLAGRVTGAALRVPVASVSSIELTMTLNRDTDPDALTAFLSDLPARGPVFGTTDKPLVSTDLRARPESLILALPETRMTTARTARVFGWYDNEWGFSSRMIDMALHVGRPG